MTHVSAREVNLGTALVAKLIADFNQLIFNDLHAKVHFV